MDDPTPQQAAPRSLEESEVERALQAIDVREQMLDDLPAAIGKAGGELLFELPRDRDDLRWAGAVAFGEGKSRQLAIVSLPADGGPAKVEPATSSALPMERITESYAGLLSHLRPAA